MTYTGVVRPGGEPATRSLGAVGITKMSVGPLDNNAYLLTCRATGARLLVDAAAEPERILALIGAGKLDVVVTTHRHGDHWQALAPVVAATGARSVAHEADASAIGGPVDETVRDGESVHFGAVALEVVHLGGHTPGAISLLHRDTDASVHLFTGDCLFPGGPGKTHSPEEFATLMGGLQEKVFGRLPDSTWVYPGHGNDTTLGAERSDVGSWWARGW